MPCTNVVTSPVAGYLERAGSRRARRPADRRRVGPPLLPRAAARGRRPYVLAVHARRSTSPRCPSSTSRELFAAMPVPVPKSSATPTTSACSRSRTSATSRCRRIWAPIARRARVALPRARRPHHDAPTPRPRARRRALSALRRRLRRREADVGDRLLRRSTSSRRIAASASRAGERDELRGRVRWRSVAELAAEPRVLCHRDYHSRNLMLRRRQLYIIDFQDARMGPGHLRSRVAAPRFVRRHRRARRSTSSSTISSRRQRPTRPSARRIPAAVRRHGRAAEPEGARHVRLSGERRDGNPVYIQYIPRTLRYARENPAAASRASTRSGRCSRGTSRSCPIGGRPCASACRRTSSTASASRRVTSRS